MVIIPIRQSEICHTDAETNFRRREFLPIAHRTVDFDSRRVQIVRKQ